MQPVFRILLAVALAVPPAAQAGAVIVVGSTAAASGFWLALAIWVGLQPRPTLEVSPHHLSASPPRAPDACTWVAGVKHCPLPKLSAEPRGRPN